MIFLKPLRLSALLALVLILFIHLKNKKLRQIQIPSIKLWEKVFQDINKVKKRKVNKYLLLILHMLIGLFIILVFAEPLFISKNKDNVYTLAFDCSMSMNALEKGKTRINIVKDKAKEFIKSCPKNSKFNLVCMKDESNVLKENLNKKQVEREVKHILASSEPLDVEKSNTVLNTFGKKLVVFTDKNLFKNNRVENVGGKLDDVGVIYGSYDEYSKECYCILKNYSDCNKKVNVSLNDHNGKRIGINDCSLNKGEEKKVFFYSIKNNISQLNFRIENKDMLSENNFYVLKVSNDKKKNVVLIGENYFIEKALKSLPYINVIKSKNGDVLEDKFDFYIICKDFKGNIPKGSKTWWATCPKSILTTKEVKGEMSLKREKLTYGIENIHAYGEGFKILDKDKNMYALIKIKDEVVMCKNKNGDIYSSIDWNKSDMVLTPAFPVLVDNIVGENLEKNSSFKYKDYIINNNECKDNKLYSIPSINSSLKNIFIVGIFVLLIIEWQVFKLEY